MSQILKEKHEKLKQTMQKCSVALNGNILLNIRPHSIFNIRLLLQVTHKNIVILFNCNKLEDHHWRINTF